MPSSNDDSEESKNKGGVVIDIRKHLPPVIKGSDPASNLAVAILKTITESDEGKPHVWLAALMMSSFALQRMLKEGHKVPEDKMNLIREHAMEIADNIRIEIGYKPEDEG